MTVVSNKNMFHNKESANVTILFAKRPKLGEAKTRIAEETSQKFAYEFAKTCLVDLINKISHCDYYDLVVATDNTEDLMWFQKNFSLSGIVINQKKNNSISDQSSVFQYIFSIVLNKERYQKAILIPMDIPFITEEDLISAFARLKHNEFILGPEVNGGVYLIGMKNSCLKEIFQGVRWSTSSSFNDLLENCGEEKTAVLKLKSDLNLPADILRLEEEIRHNCPILYSFLEKNSYYFSVKDKYINFDDLSICIPVVSNVIQNKEKGDIKIVLQTRYKPTIDPSNINKIEIPSGLIKKYELAHNAAIREAREETGIITRISDTQTIKNRIRIGGEEVVVYKPFCCQQQLVGGRAYLSVGFISDFIKGNLRETKRETRNPRWVGIDEVKELIEKRPDKIFPLSLVILKEYLNFLS